MQQADIIARTMGVAKESLSFFSALSKDGRDGVWARIEELLGEMAEAGAGDNMFDNGGGVC